MKAQDVMTKNVHVVTMDTSIMEVARLMAREDIGSVPVHADDKLVGMVTDRDIVVRAIAEGLDASSTRAGDVMSESIKYCRADDDVVAIARNMSELGVRRLPVVDADKRLVGFISQRNGWGAFGAGACVLLQGTLATCMGLAAR